MLKASFSTIFLTHKLPATLWSTSGPWGLSYIKTSLSNYLFNQNSPLLLWTNLSIEKRYQLTRSMFDRLTFQAFQSTEWSKWASHLLNLLDRGAIISSSRGQGKTLSWGRFWPCWTWRLLQVVRTLVRDRHLWLSLVKREKFVAISRVILIILITSQGLLFQTIIYSRKCMLHPSLALHHHLDMRMITYRCLLLDIEKSSLIRKGGWSGKHLLESASWSWGKFSGPRSVSPQSCASSPLPSCSSTSC